FRKSANPLPAGRYKEGYIIDAKRFWFNEIAKAEPGSDGLARKAETFQLSIRQSIDYNYFVSFCSSFEESVDTLRREIAKRYYLLFNSIHLFEQFHCFLVPFCNFLQEIASKTEVFIK